MTDNSTASTELRCVSPGGQWPDMWDKRWVSSCLTCEKNKGGDLKCRPRSDCWLMSCCLQTTTGCSSHLWRPETVYKDWLGRHYDHPAAVHCNSECGQSEGKVTYNKSYSCNIKMLNYMFKLYTENETDKYKYSTSMSKMHSKYQKLKYSLYRKLALWVFYVEMALIWSILYKFGQLHL